jgi:hypothetical protein
MFYQEKTLKKKNKGKMKVVIYLHEKIVTLYLGPKLLWSHNWFVWSYEEERLTHDFDKYVDTYYDHVSEVKMYPFREDSKNQMIDLQTFQFKNGLYLNKSVYKAVSSE